MNTQTEQNNRPQQTQLMMKEAYVVNDELDFAMMNDNLDYFSNNKIPVMVSPNIMLESIMAEIRSRDYFAQIDYNPMANSHIIVKIFPKMIPVADFFAGRDERFNFSQQQTEMDMSYPETK